MAGLLVAIGAMGVLMSMILPVWSQSAKREREAELIFRGEQYARAITLYQRRYVGAHPPDLETLVDGRFLRRLYEDPMSEDGEFKVVYQSEADEVQAGTAATGRAGRNDAEDGEDDEPSSSTDQNGSFSNPNRFGSRPTGGVVGVVSTSDESSLRIYNGQEKYSEWAFVYTPSSTDPAAVAGSGNTTGAGRGFGGTGGRGFGGGGGRGAGGASGQRGRSRSGTSPNRSFGGQTRGTQSGATR